MALEMQKIYEEDSARLKRQKSGRTSRSDPAKGIMKKNIVFQILLLSFIGERYNTMILFGKHEYIYYTVWQQNKIIILFSLTLINTLSTLKLLLRVISSIVNF